MCANWMGKWVKLGQTLHQQDLEKERRQIQELNDQKRRKQEDADSKKQDKDTAIKETLESVQPVVTKIEDLIRMAREVGIDIEGPTLSNVIVSDAIYNQLPECLKVTIKSSHKSTGPDGTETTTSYDKGALAYRWYYQKDGASRNFFINDVVNEENFRNGRESATLSIIVTRKGQGVVILVNNKEFNSYNNDLENSIGEALADVVRFSKV